MGLVYLPTFGCVGKHTIQWILWELPTKCDVVKKFCDFCIDIHYHLQPASNEFLSDFSPIGRNPQKPKTTKSK